MVVQSETNIVENHRRSENNGRSASRSRDKSRRDLNLAFLRLPVTTVANQVTRNLNVDISSEIKKLALLSQTKLI